MTLDAEAQMKQLGMGFEDDEGTAVRLGQAVQAQLVALMVRSLLAVLDDAAQRGPEGDDNDRQSDEP
jgi:hypothetical protein